MDEFGRIVQRQTAPEHFGVPAATLRRDISQVLHDVTTTGHSASTDAVVGYHKTTHVLIIVFGGRCGRSEPELEAVLSRVVQQLPPQYAATSYEMVKSRGWITVPLDTEAE